MVENEIKAPIAEDKISLEMAAAAFAADVKEEDKEEDYVLLAQEEEDVNP